MRRRTLRAASGDWTRFPLDAREAFLLSQLDGTISLEDLASALHLDPAEVDAMADRLVQLGAAAVVGGVARKDRSRPPARSGHPRSGHPRSGPPRSRPPHPGSQRPGSERRREGEESELDAPLRARVEELARSLRTIDHYVLLGVAPDADVKSVKRAYFAKIREFHPDRFFGKTLGAMETQLQRLVTRLTEAHDTLCDRERRAAYDAKIGKSARPAPVRRASARAAVTARVEGPRRRHSSTAATKPRKTTRPPVAATPRSKTGPPRKSATPPAEPPAPTPSTGAATLPAGRVPVRKLAGQAHADLFVRAAEEALSKNDVVAAAHHYKLAFQCTGDPVVRTALEETEARARVHLRERAVARGRDAERAQRWKEAAAEYTKAYGMRADPALGAKIARALVMTSTDVARALQLAEQAVGADPAKGEYRLVLGEALYAAGILDRAAAETKRAGALLPGDERVKHLAAEIARARRER